MVVDVIGNLVRSVGLPGFLEPHLNPIDDIPDIFWSGFVHNGFLVLGYIGLSLLLSPFVRISLNLFDYS